MMYHFLADHASAHSSRWGTLLSISEVEAATTLSLSGAALSAGSALLVAVLACALHCAASSAEAKGVDETSCLIADCKGQDQLDPVGVRHVALVGSIVALGLSTLAGWLVLQLAPLATAAIGISLLFTLRPVNFPGDKVGLPIISLNMAVAPWLCIGWQFATGAMPLHVFVHGILGEPESKILPWTMLVTFMGAVYLCASLETTGGPSAVARAIAGAFGSSQSQLFACFAVMASCMTVLIPDDVVTMTLAPTICVLCKSLKIDAEPHLYAQFYCANIFAVTLITGNITNVLIAGVTNDEFLAFARVMVLPGLIAGVCSVFLLYITFGKDRFAGAPSVPDEKTGDSNDVRYPTRALICSTRLAFAFAVAAFDGVHGWPIWATIGIFGFVSLCIDLCLDAARVDGTSKYTWDTVATLPFELFLFFPALFILAQQLVHVGVVDGLAGSMAIIANSPVRAMAFVGFVSMWAAQAVSTAPMTIVFLQVITRVPGWEAPMAGSSAELARNLSLYALVLGSNFCGNISRMGTLGGQMWFRIARGYDIHLSHGRMVLRSVAIMTPVMAVALVVLYYTYNHFR